MAGKARCWVDRVSGQPIADSRGTRREPISVDAGQFRDGTVEIMECMRCSGVTSWEERNVETVSIRAHSSFRIIVDYTPKKSNRGESSLELRGQSFFLLFEIRSKRDYGEIGLFCRAQTCQSRLAVTPAIHYRNCVPGGSFTQSMVITNEVGISGFFWTNIGSLRWRVPRLSRVPRRRCGSRIPRWNRWPRRTWRGCRRRSLTPSPISPIPSLFQKTGRFPSR